MNYEHFIFDVDGTLVDNEFAVLQAWKEALLEIQGKVYETEELTFVLGIPGEVTFSRLGIKETKAASAIWRSYFLKYKHTVKLFDGMAETLATLKEKGVRLGIVTSRTPSEFAEDAVLREIAGYFGTVICVTDAPRPKPFADPILAYLERTGARPEEALYIGDAVYDSRCARSAGVDFGLVIWGDRAKEDIEAKYRFAAPGEIARYC